MWLKTKAGLHHVPEGARISITQIGNAAEHILVLTDFKAPSYDRNFIDAVYTEGQAHAMLGMIQCEITRKAEVIDLPAIWDALCANGQSEGSKLSYEVNHKDDESFNLYDEHNNKIGEILTGDEHLVNRLVTAANLLAR